MRIVFTGGGTGGHFYPIIAVAEAIHEIVDKEKILEPELYYLGPDVLDKTALAEQNIIYKPSPAGKMRRYFSIQNFFDVFKTLAGIIKATWQLYWLYPDVVFSKGGYAAFPTTVAARILGIPLIIHESDAKPGKANLIASKWAKAIAVSYPGTADYFIEKGVPKEKIALTGHPVRSALFKPVGEGAHHYLGLNKDVPTVLIVGGSLGAKAINSTVLDALKRLVDKYQVIHQTGKDHIEDVKKVASVILKDHPHKHRYHPFGFLNQLAMRMASGAANLIVSRAGAGMIAEISIWGLPAIVIPIPEEISHDQTENAFVYASIGAATVIKQKNLTPTILVAEIDRILSNPELQAEMSSAAVSFAKPKAAETIARQILEVALSHVI